MYLDVFQQNESKQNETRVNERNAHTIGPSGDDAPHVLSSLKTPVQILDPGSGSSARFPVYSSAFFLSKLTKNS